jgi:phage gp36-like protein
MSFLTPDDYGLQIRDEIRDLVTDGDETLLATAALTAQTEMESYLHGRYDVEAVFSTTGEGRNRQVVLYLVDMALYHLHSRQNPRHVPQIRQDRYDHAINWLKAAAAGRISAGLPKLAVATAPGRFKWGSEPRQTLSW